MMTNEQFFDVITNISDRIFEANKAVGWWDDAHVVPNRYLIPTKIALMHSELSEGLEGYRKSLMDDHLPHRPMFEVELADAMIRIMDTAGYLGYDLGGAIMEKLAYNAQRADHKRENREKEGGKSI
jgi:hypothetical protein